jgi:hypothetical protein
MLKPVFTITFLLAAYMCYSQVKIGYNSGTVNPAAILELSNDTANVPSTWKSFLPAQVNFSNPVFSTNYIWGIAGTPTAGAIVYNVGESYNNGFSGPGLYCWQRNSWAPISIIVIDKIRVSLSSSIATYDAATVNSWVNITAAEYNNLLVVVNGAAKYATPEIYMNTSSSGGWSPNYTIGGSNNVSRVPASNYIIAWSVRTGNGIASSLGSKLKISTSQSTSYTDYGNPLPNIGNIAVNTRVYFVLKTPNMITPAAAPSYTAVYNALTFFLGNNTFSSSGPEYYGAGDVSNFSGSFASDSYSQVISTATRQW